MEVVLQAIKATAESDIHRYAAANKALRLIKHHSSLFQLLIGLNSRTSYEILFNCHTAAKDSLKKHMNDALHAVLTEIARYVLCTAALLERKEGEPTKASKGKGKAKEDKVPPELRGAVETVKLLFNSFMKQIQDDSSEDILYAVKGITCLAPAFHPCFGSSSSLLDILESIVNSAEHYVASSELKSKEGAEGSFIVRLNSHTTRNKVLYFSAVTSLVYSHSMRSSQSLGGIVFPEKIRNFLLDYSVDSIMGYSKVWPVTQLIITRTLCQLLHALYRLKSLCKVGGVELIEVANATSTGNSQTSDEFSMRSLFADYLAVVVPALYLRTVSRKLDGEEMTSTMVSLSDITGDIDDRLFYVYIHLWEELLDPSDSQTKGLMIMNFNPDYFATVSRELFEEFITYLVRTIKALDLSYTYSDTASTVLPNNIADQDILLNTVSFLERFFKRIKSHLLFRWLRLLSSLLIDLSTTYPLVSALYRFFNCLLHAVQDEIDKALTSKSSTEAMELPSVITNIRSFLLLVQSKATSDSFFRDELLDAVLKLLLTAPSTVITFPDVVVAIEMSLKSGLQVSSCVDFITKHLLSDRESVSKFVPSFVRLFDKYLLTFENDKVEEKLVKTIAKKTTKSSSDSLIETTSTNKELQISILRLLGRLGGASQQMLIAPQETVSSSICWTFEERIVVKYPVVVIPSDSMTSEELRLCFDKLLPRLTSICSSSVGADKQLIIAAAECLHSLIIFMIGDAASTFAMKKPSMYSEIYAKVLPVVIKLAASAGNTCQAVFETVLFQLVRWFAGQNHVHEEDAAALLDSLIGCMCSSSAEHSEKSICYRSLTEYFVWTIKQSTKKELARSSTAVDLLMTKITTLLSRPTAEDWYTAAAILSKIYKHFREESTLVNKYALRIFFLLLQVLRNDVIYSTEVFYA